MNVYDEWENIKKILSDNSEKEYNLILSNDSDNLSICAYFYILKRILQNKSSNKKLDVVEFNQCKLLIGKIYTFFEKNDWIIKK